MIGVKGEEAVLGGLREPAGEGFLGRTRVAARRLGRFFVRKPLGAVGTVIIVVMVGLAISAYVGLADNVTGYDLDHQVLTERLQGPDEKPSPGHGSPGT